MNEADRKRFTDICRRAQYGVTLKELAWLISMVVKLDDALQKQFSAVSSQFSEKTKSRATARR